ncbi:hypothetical protein CBR_g46805 [Chara braunii]|uniref:Flavin reductase like domain-containing protein n=1 Tax=Chara braunii TaxID=69332 RepID=A0A388M0Z1_CHABU|nr:hypothetical protein CBR_g46805 [Chara braunii]|eukprot:GBG88238.1 hypothetical protein CBR_g46805 [Chara braunii]
MAAKERLLATASDARIKSILDLDSLAELLFRVHVKVRSVGNVGRKVSKSETDRFEGLEWAPAKSGSPILLGTVAFMECKVVSRMETPDHWIVYSHVTDGSVSKPDARTAAHHRKIGNYY